MKISYNHLSIGVFAKQGGRNRPGTLAQTDLPISRNWKNISKHKL
jgi:hypothetical protein